MCAKRKISTPFPERITLTPTGSLAVYPSTQTLNRHNLRSVLSIWAVVAGVLLSLAFRGQRKEFSRKLTAVKPEKCKLFGQLGQQRLKSIAC